MTTTSTPYTRALQGFYNKFAKHYNAGTSTIHAGGPERLVAAAGPAIQEGSWVLDLATGTGKVALVAAAKVGAGGRVLGIDISDELLGIAQDAARGLGLGPPNVAFRVQDVGALEELPEAYAGRRFDAVTCGSAISLFADHKALFDGLARTVLKPGGVFVADLWTPFLPAKLFLDAAVPRGFAAPMDPLWIADSEAAFRRAFVGSGFALRSVEAVGESRATWDVGSEAKVEALWRSLAEEQTWLSFGLEGMGEGVVAEIKAAWREELEGCKDGEGVVAVTMRQWVAVAVLEG